MKMMDFIFAAANGYDLIDAALPMSACRSIYTNTGSNCPDNNPCLHAYTTYPNGYGISILHQHHWNYDSWEIAILEVKGDITDIAYNTGLTEDVIYVNSIEGITTVIDIVKKLRLKEISII